MSGKPFSPIKCGLGLLSQSKSRLLLTSFAVFTFHLVLFFTCSSIVVSSREDCLLLCTCTENLCQYFRIDEELIGVPMMGGGVVSNMTLMPPPPASPKQMIRGGSGKQRSLKRFATTTSGSNRSMPPQQLPSVEYISERASDVSFSGMSGKKRNGKPPSGKCKMIP